MLSTHDSCIIHPRFLHYPPRLAPEEREAVVAGVVQLGMCDWHEEEHHDILLASPININWLHFSFSVWVVNEICDLISHLFVISAGNNLPNKHLWT